MAPSGAQVDTRVVDNEGQKLRLVGPPGQPTSYHGNIL